MPVSLIGTFAVMAAMGFSLNNLTLFGLVLAIGIVVDDAIVVLENTERMIKKGYDARTATIKAMEEITGPIMAITLALCSVFVPCCFIGGITGQFFRQFAVTIAVSTIISAINALTMTPSRAVLIFKTEEGAHGGHEFKREALPWWIFGVVGGLLADWYGPDLLAGRFGLPAEWRGPVRAKPSVLMFWIVSAAYFIPGAIIGGLVGRMIIRPVNAVLGWLFRGFNRLFDGVTEVYGWTVGKLLRLSVVVLLAYGGLVGTTYWVLERRSHGLHSAAGPGPGDRGCPVARLGIAARAPMEVMAAVESIARETPGVAHTVTLAGMSFLLQANSSNLGCMFIVLDPFDERRVPGRHADDIIARLLREYPKRVKDAVVTVRNSSPIPGLGVAGGFKIVVEDRGGNGLAALQQQTDKLTRALGAEPGLTNVNTGFRSRTPQLFLDIDRTKAEALGLSFDDVNQTLSMYLGSLYVNSFNEFGRHWQVTVQLEGDFRNRVEDINLLQVRNKWGQMVPMGTLVRVKEIGGPISVTRYNLYISCADHRQHETGDELRGRHRGGQSSGRRDPASLHDRRVDRADVRSDQGGRENPGDVHFRDLGGRRLFGSGGLVRELVAAAGGHPGGADVHALFRVRRALHGAGSQYFRADRPGSAGGAGVQERHSDRRVCQTDAPGGLVAA